MPRSGAHQRIALSDLLHLGVLHELPALRLPLEALRQRGPGWLQRGCLAGDGLQNGRLTRPGLRGRDRSRSLLLAGLLGSRRQAGQGRNAASGAKRHVIKGPAPSVRASQYHRARTQGLRIGRLDHHLPAYAYLELPVAERDGEGIEGVRLKLDGPGPQLLHLLALAADDRHLPRKEDQVVALVLRRLTRQAEAHHSRACAGPVLEVESEISRGRDRPQRPARRGECEHAVGDRCAVHQLPALQRLCLEGLAHGCGPDGLGGGDRGLARLHHGRLDHRSSGGLLARRGRRLAGRGRRRCCRAAGSRREGDIVDRVSALLGHEPHATRRQRLGISGCDELLPAHRHRKLPTADLEPDLIPGARLQLAGSAAQLRHVALAELPEQHYLTRHEHHMVAALIRRLPRGTDDRLHRSPSRPVLE